MSVPPTHTRDTNVVDSPVGVVDTEGFTCPHFVIAALDTDNAWIAMPEATAPTLSDWL